MASNNNNHNDGSIITGGSSKYSQRKSAVWNRFEYLRSSRPDGGDEAKCIRCGSKLKAGGKKYGTAHLKRHVNSDKCTAVAEQRIWDLLDEANSNGTLFSSQ